MNGRELIKALHTGERVYGTLLVSTSPHWPAAVKSTGADFVFIDTEHIAIDRTTLAWMCQSYRALGLAPTVRIPAPDPYQATVALDNGASGVLACWRSLRNNWASLGTQRFQRADSTMRAFLPAGVRPTPRLPAGMRAHPGPPARRRVGGA